MELNIGLIGASRNRYSEHSVLEFIIQLKDENPTIDLKRAIKLYAERAAEDEDWRYAAVQHAVTNEWRNLHRQEENRQRRSSTAIAERKAERTQVVQSVKEQIMLLNLPMPNGKLMRYCTGAEMVKFGGAYTRIGKKIGTTKQVGQALDENGVRALMK